MASTLKVPFSVYVCKSGEGGNDESNIASFRFEHQEVPAWEDMKAMVKAQYDIAEDVLLKHIDAEHEEITIGSEEEWKLAVMSAEKESNQLFLKVFRIPEKKAKGPRPQPPKCKKAVLRSHLMNINSKVDHLTKELSTVKLTQQQQEEIIRQAAIGSTSKSNDGEGRQIVHDEIFCSLCREAVVGIRYKCANCSQYNLCEKCEKGSERSHPETHVFLKLNMPIDRKVDIWISKAPLLGCNLYDSSSVERFLRKMYRRSHHRRHSSSSGSSTSGSSTSTSGSSSDDESERRRHEIERRRNRRKHGRGSSNSTSTHDVRRRRKYRRRRSTSSSSHTSTGSSSTGTSSSYSASIITLDSNIAKSRSTEVCRYGHHHKRRPCLYHQEHQRHSHNKSKAGSSSSHRHRRGHRHHRHHGRRRGHAEEQPLLSRSSVTDVRPPSTFDCIDEVQQLVDWTNAHDARRAREIMEQDTIPAEAPNSSQKDGLTDVMMTEQEMQQFRARLNKLVDVPKLQEEVDNSTEYFVQTGCGLGDWVPITDQPSVSVQTNEAPESTCEFSLVDSPPPEKQPERELIDLDTLEPDTLPTAPHISIEDTETTAGMEGNDAVEAPVEAQKSANNNEEKSAKEPEEVREPPMVVDLTDDTPKETSTLTETASESMEAVIVDKVPKETSEPPQAEAAHPQAPQCAYPAPHYPPYQQYPVGGCPVYPYPPYPANIDGQTAANLWSATTNVLRSINSGFQGFVGGQANGPRPAPEVRPYDYHTNKEMQQLVEMGFCNRQLNQRLLEKHNQNVDRVVSELINETNDTWYDRRH